MEFKLFEMRQHLGLQNCQQRKRVAVNFQHVLDWHQILAGVEI